MKKWIVIIAAAIYGAQRGYAFLTSDKFQEYGDQKKAPWTCYVDNTLGQLLIVMSEYERSVYYFDHTLKRCPDSSMGEVAMFNRAKALEACAPRREAVQAYRSYLDKYPTGEYAKLAQRSVELLSGL